MYLFLGFLFCPTNLCVCPSASTLITVVIEGLEIWQVDFILILLFVFKVVLVILEHSPFYTHFRINLFVFTKNFAGIWIAIALNLYIYLVRAIFTMLNLLFMNTVCFSSYLGFFSFTSSSFC